MVQVTLEAKKTNPTHMLGFEDEDTSGQFHYRYRGKAHQWRPPTDVYETDDAILIKIEIAGMRESDFSIFLDDRKVSVQGTRQDQESKRAYHQMEIRNGEFNSEIALHWPIDSKGVEAEYKDGFLRILLPKAKTIQIDINE